MRQNKEIPSASMESSKNRSNKFRSNKLMPYFITPNYALETLKMMATEYGLYAAKYAGKRLVNHFGKYYVIPIARIEGGDDDKLLMFLRKHIPQIFGENILSKYFEFITDTNFAVGITKIPQVVKIVEIDYHTYIYINTIRFTTDTKERPFGDMYIFGKKSRKYIKELDEIMKPKDNSLGKEQQSVYTVNSGHDTDWNIVLSYVKCKKFDQLFYSNNEIENIGKHIDNFIETMDIYKKKGIPYKTGILLYGKPGTGKTSLVNAICTEYNRKMVNINVNNIQNIDLVELSNILDNDTEEDYVVVFEDIDTLFLNRDEEKTDANRDYYEIIQKLLQFLDGVSSPNNVIFVATTNYKSRLDEAIIREGRFDLKIEVKGLMKKEAILMIKTFGFDDNEATKILHNVEVLEDGLYNQAKLQTEILNHLGIKNFKETDFNEYMTDEECEE